MVGRTGGYGKDGNADVFRILIEDGKVVRSVNLHQERYSGTAQLTGAPTHLLARGTNRG